ncbi:hypothetical protein [Sphingomonas sp. 28-62-20]|uniref:hypothetical protein n=1 Tax=Sphingomonas sp. 28-62-20 TaxID=1970433 RepID=UPI00267B01D2
MVKAMAIGTAGFLVLLGTACNQGNAAYPASAIATSIPNGRYLLKWKAEQRAGVGVSISVKSKDRTQAATGGQYTAEFSVRNNKLSGCVLSDPVRNNAVVAAQCTMANDKLMIVLGNPVEKGSGIKLEMVRDNERSYIGQVLVSSALLPLGSIKIGNATMTPLN